MKATDPGSVRAAKKAIRAEVAAALQLMSQDARARATGRAFAQLDQTDAWRGAKRVMLYAPMPIEPVLDCLWVQRANREFCYPRIVGRELEARMVTAVTQLRPAAFGLREPDLEQTTVVDPATLDLVVVPGLAFTRDGGRLGRGRGYYDRFLAALPAEVSTVALAFACQMRDTLPMEPHDYRVQMVFTG